MQTFKIQSLKKNTSFSADLMIDNNFMLLPADALLTESMIKAVQNWEFETVQCNGTISVESMMNNSEPKQQEIKKSSPTEQINASVKKAFANTKNQIVNTDKSRMEIVNNFYTEYMNYITSVYTHYTTHGEINQKELTDTVQDLCVFIKENRRYVLRIQPQYTTTAKSYIINHTMRSTVLAIAIALQLHMPLTQMTDLGIACILHEIGMLCLPPQLYMTQRKLTLGERKKIKTHPIEGLKIIQNLDFPGSIQMGILQHHEKENGSGYPQGIPGEKITNIAKIISVACTYEAITSPRNYKSEKTSFDAMLEMLKNENHQYDETIIKALLYSVSLFPIGAYVYLKSGKIGIVIDVNPENPKLPIVQLLLDKEKDGSPKTVQTDNQTNQIVRVLSIKEQQDVIKTIQEKEKLEQEIKAKEESNKVEEQPVSESKKSNNGVEEIDVSFFD